METEVVQETWEVEVGGQIYHAVYSELPDWIAEGSLQPGDLVRKGNLRWIEAGKVPGLMPLFNARAAGGPLPTVVGTANNISPAAAAQPTASPVAVTVAAPAAVHQPTASPVNQISRPKPAVSKSSPSAATQQATVDGMCLRHRDAPAAFVCDSCSGQFCKACPAGYGGNVKICPECGSMCRSLKELNEKLRQQNIVAGASDRKFGFQDLAAAFSYPFNFRTSLIMGSVIFAFFTLGQSAASIGGIFLIGAAFVCMMLSNMMTFGVLSNTVNNFVQGRFETDFMPSFDDFSIIDDVLRPFVLSIAVYISSFLPFLIIAAIAVYMAFSAMQQQMQSMEDRLKQIPGTEFYAPDRTAEQSREVQQLIESAKRQNDARLRQQQSLTQTAAAEIQRQQQEDAERMLAEVQQKRAQALSNDQARLSAGLFQQFLSVAAPLIVLAAIAMIWGLFYFPAACAVAGYTRSFRATINPLVGLDTIRRLGFTYVKIVFMCVLLTMIMGFVGGIFAVILSPFHMERMGNLPASFLTSIFTFYITIVFSAMIGYALYRNADKLALPR